MFPSVKAAIFYSRKTQSEHRFPTPRHGQTVSITSVVEDAARSNSAPVVFDMPRLRLLEGADLSELELDDRAVGQE